MSLDPASRIVDDALLQSLQASGGNLSSERDSLIGLYNQALI